MCMCMCMCMCVGMCMCLGMCMCMWTNMCINIVYRHVHRHVHRYMHRHVYGHVHGYARRHRYRHEYRHACRWQSVSPQHPSTTATWVCPRAHVPARTYTHAQKGACARIRTRAHAHMRRSRSKRPQFCPGARSVVPIKVILLLEYDWRKLPAQLFIAMSWWPTQGRRFVL